MFPTKNKTEKSDSINFNPEKYPESKIDSTKREKKC